jgi:exodeoxyribonuclease V beta subunit
MAKPNPNLDPLALPLNGSTLIEASAGTGKTFTIAILYVRLVLGHGQPEGGALAAGLVPPNLLVVTFTDAATKELRDRIRVRLTQAAEVFSNVAGSDTPTAETALVHQLRDDGYPDPASWPDCRKKLLLAAEWMDEAAVSTIHAWCNRMLSEHAFDSGSLFRLTLETDQSSLMDEVVRDYWRTFIYPLDCDKSSVLISWWSSPAELGKALKSLIGKVKSPILVSESVETLIDNANRQKTEYLQELKEHWQQWCPELREWVDATQNFKKASNKLIGGAQANALKTALSHLEDWAESDKELPKNFLERNHKRPKGYLYLTEEGLSEIWRGAEPFPRHSAMAEIVQLEIDLRRLPTAKSDILQHALAWTNQRLESEKQKRSEMGFDDLLTRLDDALHGPRGDQLAATIRRQFPVALIDEFQDTDPVQYRIFDRIYRVAENHPDTCLLMIGDPKQAIYGFRGADIYTYLDARTGARDRTWTLGRNFRSSQPMVAAVNRVFEYGDQHGSEGAFLFGKGKASALPFQAVEAHGTKRLWAVNGELQPSLTLWASESESIDKSGNRKGLAKGGATVDVASTCASEIARLLTLGQQSLAGFALETDLNDIEPVEPKDIAILVNNRNEAAAVRNALGQRGIKSVYLSDRDSVLTSQESKEVLCWLKAFAEPRQLAYARAALATPTLGLPWSYLDQLLTNEMALEREIERFMGYQQQWQSQGVLPMLRSFLMDFDVPGKLLQRVGGERRLTDILHIAELLQQDSLQLDGEHALVHHFTAILRAADEEDEHRTLRLESDAGLVKVITVHKSKGLEYPLVFLPFGTAYRAENEKQAFVRYHDANDQLITVFDPTPNDVEQADKERLGEDIRKLYVALTRARFATWVGVTEIENWQFSGLGYLLSGNPAATQSLGGALKQLAAGRSELFVESLPEATDEHFSEPAPAALGPALVSTREAREDWWIASYSSLEYSGLSGTGITFESEFEDAEAQNLREESTHTSDEQDAAIVLSHSLHYFPKGAGPGTFLHDILEWCVQQGLQHLVDSPTLLREQLTRRCSTRGWSDWVDTLEHWILALIRQPLPLGYSRDGSDSGDSISLANLKTLRPELEFWFESRNVSTRALDKLVTQNTLNGADRPRVEGGRFNGMLKGFIDLVFEHNGQYYVLDYKSNVLGDSDSAYTNQAMGEAILEKRYDLQYVLYLLALHRLLKARLPDYDYDQHVGGAVYMFLRGIHAPGAGAFCDKPPKVLMEQLDAMFDGKAAAAEVAA